MDTPRDVAARVRFAKYRGLRSWRSSEWDPKEGLPQEYGRVFAFQNPTRAQKRCGAGGSYCRALVSLQSRVTVATLK